MSPAAIKAHRESGVTRRYERPAGEVFEASAAAVDRIRVDKTYWSGLEVVERDPGQGTVIAEQRLDSAVIPGLGTRDAIGIFVSEASSGASDVTVVVMGSDQIPGSAGTRAESLPTAAAIVFPAIDAALEAIPQRPAEPAAAASPRNASAAEPPAALAPVRTMATSAPSSAGGAPAPRGKGFASMPSSGSSPVSASLLDRVYEALRGTGAWRPLVREVREDSVEEVRVGRWASLTDAGGRVQLAVCEGASSAAAAARLALDLSQSGFAVVVESEKRRGCSH